MLRKLILKIAMIANKILEKMKNNASIYSAHPTKKFYKKNSIYKKEFHLFKNHQHFVSNARKKILILN
jgi:hypothetical protein